MRRALILVLAAVATGTVLMGVDAVRVHRDLAAVRSELPRIRTAVGDGRVPDDALAIAVTAADRADERVRRVHWTVAGHIPLLGRSFTTVRRIVQLTAAATELVDGQLRAVQPILEGRTLDVAALRTARDALSHVSDATLVSATRELEAAPGTWVPHAVAEARTEAVSAATELASLQAKLRTGLRTIPDFLGADGERRYLVVLQNSAELRGTGGVIAWWGVVTVIDGRFELERLGRENELADLRHGDLPSRHADPTFTRRYAHVDALGDVHNANVDPDLPTVAPVVLEHFRPLVGGTVDGVIALDPFALAMLLAGTEIDLPDELVPAGISDPLPSEDLPRVTTIDAYQHFGGASPERARFLAAVARSGFAALLDVDRDVATARRVGSAATGRHLQLYSVHPEVQEGLLALGVAGHLPSHPGTDLLAVTANNAAANKMDVHVRHRVSARVRFDPPDGASGCTPLRRQTTVQISVDNRLVDPGLDRYVIGSPGPAGDLDGPSGLNRTWFTVWAPGGTSEVAGRDGAGGPLEARVDGIHGHVAIDHVLDTPMDTVGSYEIDLAGPVEAPCEAGRRRYALTWWRQAKGIPDELRIELEAPGWVFDGLEVAGGIDPSSTWGETSPMMVTEKGATATIVGKVGSDLHVSVLLSPEPVTDPG